MNKLKIPFITTSLIADIKWSFILLPVWWLLGIEQFIWPFLTVIMAIKFLLLSIKNKEFKITFSLTHKIIFVFLGVYIISGLFIVESYRYLTFLRNFIVYFSAFLMFFIASHAIKNKNDFLYILKGLIFLIFFISVVSIFAFLNIIDFKYTSPMQFVFPEFIKETSMGKRILTRELYQIQRIRGIGEFKRPAGFFYTANHLAAVILILIPFNLFLLKYSRPTIKFFLYFLMLILILLLFLTTSRGALVGLVAGVLYFIFFKVFIKEKDASLFMFNILIIIIIIYSIILYPFIVNSLNLVIKIRSDEGLKDRLNIYEDTLNSWKERPIFGWGTQRDVDAHGRPTEYYSMGSHSTYLAILYQQGTVGLLIYLFILFSLIREIFITIKRKNSSFLQNLVLYASFAFVMNIIHALTEGMDLDVTTLHLVWLNWGFIIAASRLSKKKYLNTNTVEQENDYFFNHLEK